MRLTVSYDGEPNGLRREVRNAFGLVERGAEPQPIVHSLAIVFHPVPKSTTAPGVPGMPFSLDYDYIGTIPQPRDAKGNPTDYDGPIAWESLDPEVAEVVAESDDGKRIRLRTRAIGTFEYEGTVDLDRGEGVRPFTHQFTGEVVAGDALGIEEPGFERVAKDAAETPAA